MRSTTARGLVAAALLPGLLGLGLSGAAASPGSSHGTSAAAAEERAPLWRTDLPGILHSYDTGFEDGAVLDPATGDVFSHFHDTSVLTARTRVRRTDGETGETVWEIGLGGIGSSDTELAIDPAGGQVVLSTDSRVYGIGLDGAVRWTVRSRLRGFGADLATNPATGISCLTGHYDNVKVGRKARATWYLACYDRDGNPVGTRRFEHRGLTSGPTALGVDPERGTWYVAGTHHVVGGGSRTVLLAYREGGKRRWKATRDHRDRRAEVTDLEVGARGIVHVGGGRRAGATLVSWTADGRPWGDRSWKSGRIVEDLAADVPGRRVVAALDTRRGTQVRVLRPRGRTLSTFEQVNRLGGGAILALDPDNGRIVVSSGHVAAYTSDGTVEWEGAERRLVAEELLVDPARNRVIVLANSFTPVAQMHLSAYPR